ncbi:Monocarboxylate transporter-like protein [Operophtera brumata]|uniref:Monocarboxylate transporter-like protein n=1 Tax=Operophtera brumata TaxID=104452 RepID=A0A0L7LAK4_OPEBR|nr:Monocarboxylate transporter-like protein [Operophtera brumata]
MENQENPGIRRTERNQSRVEDLNLDRVVASHPEIGPSPPDGGYGWLIVTSAVIYNITVPALLSLYGLIILKAIRDEGHEPDVYMKIWEIDIAIVPVMMVIMRLLLESWCRAMVKIFHMPRFMALSGLCLTVAGILLSSYSTDADSNDHIKNIFSGIFIGAGCALTGQQTDIIITHYFRDKLTMAQRIVRMAPSVGNCLIPILIGYLCTIYTGDAVVMIYGAIVMQNCVFLASYTRPIYIEKVIRHTYNMLRDAVEDEDEISTQCTTAAPPIAFLPILLQRQTDSHQTSVHSMLISGYQELENIDRDGRDPQPLYRETTINAPQNVVFAAEVTPGKARRTASLRKNFITIANMLMDLNFYLYALLHLTTTFSILILGVVFPPLVWEQNPSLNIWSVSCVVAVAHGSALCFIMLCVVLPKSINEKERLCAAFCVTGAIGFYGITLTGNKSLLVVWCMFSSFATAACHILQQPIYNSTLNEFDTTATMTGSNTIVAIFIMAWTMLYNYEYKTCFLMASLLQTVTAVVYAASSFRRRR